MLEAGTIYSHSNQWSENVCFSAFIHKYIFLCTAVLRVWSTRYSPRFVKIMVVKIHHKHAPKDLLRGSHLFCDDFFSV